LFERGARALKLTQEGKALHERTSPLLAEVEETVAAIASGGGPPRGNLRISAPLLFSQLAMGKLAAGFSLKYPDVILEVTTEDRAVDMVEEGMTWPFASTRVPTKVWWDGSSCVIGL
jgi:DNA-binding transcriptional LysR family regulator